MDRVITYSGALPQALDPLRLNKQRMIDAGYLNQAMLGSGGAVAGLVCTPTSPLSLSVTVGIGSVFEIDNVDATPYSDAGVDIHNIVKQGILYDPVTLTLSPPTQSGFSQVYVVEVNLTDVDAGAQVLPYFNATNPNQPFAGPFGSGTSQYTNRLCQCAVALKAGVPAVTGTQKIPAADPGWLGLYSITLPNGATQISAAMIVQIPNAAFFPPLPAIPGDIQNNIWIYCTDTGTVNNLVATVSPPPAKLALGLAVMIKVANTNTGPVTFNLNGLGAENVRRANGAVLAAGDINVGEILFLIYDGSAWQYLNFFGFSSSTLNNNTYTLAIPYALDAGVVNALIGNYAPAVTSLTAGQIVTIKAAFTNTGPSTIQCNALAPVPIFESNTVTALQPRAIVVGQVIWLQYDGTRFLKLNPRSPLYAINLSSSPPSGDVPMAVGDWFTYTFNGATQIALHTAVVPGGVYDIELVVVQNNSQNTDLFLLPNNTTYPNSFSTYIMESTDDPSVPLSNSQPFVGIWPRVIAHMAPNRWENTPATLSYDCFAMDLMAGPENALDQINDQGPFMVNIVIVTTTIAKRLRYRGAIRGGLSIGHGIWEDTTTPWTSLGTLVAPQPAGGGFTTPYAALTGAAVVRRLA